MESRAGRPAGGGGGVSGEQLDDECQLWGRALKLLDSRLGSQSPRDRVFWKTSGPASKCVCLSLGLSRHVRASLLKVCDECEDRRVALGSLRESERHLQADLRYAQEKMRLYKERLNDIQQGADSARQSGASSLYQESLVDGLTSDREQELLNSKSVANSRAKALEAKVEAQEVEIHRLRKKLQSVEKAELERQQRQQEVFRSLRHRKPTKNSPLDNKMLEIIDGYETELQRLRRRLREPEKDGEDESEDDDESGQDRGYRLVVEELNQQLAALAEDVQRLENEKEMLSVELDSRPTNSDHVLLASKLSRYERLLKRHNIDASKQEAPGASGKEFSTRVEDIELLPLSQCQRFLRETVRLLGVADLKEIGEAVGDLVSISEAYGVVHPVLLEAENLTQDERSPPVPDALVAEFGDDRFQRLLPVLAHWRAQMLGLPELRQSLRRLLARLYPWLPQDRLAPGCEVKQLVETVDLMASDEMFAGDGGDGQRRRPDGEQPPPAMLQGIVDHFRKLFDVGPISGVFTKMNAVYAELGVYRNALNSIRNSLSLDAQYPVESVVQAVAKLIALERQSVNAKLQEIFSQEDVQLALNKLEEYEEFFPAFEELVKNLMDVLEIGRVDEILPAVTAYKRAVDLAGSNES